MAASTPGAEQLAGRGPVERAERDRRRATLALGARERAPRGGPGRGPRARPRRSATAAAGGRSSSATSRSIDAGVGALEVVEDEHDRPVARERLEQRADGAVGAVALARAGGRRRRQRRPDGRIVARAASWAASTRRGGGRARRGASSASTQTP